MVQPRPLFSLFSFFSNLAEKNCRLQQDTNSDCQRGRRARWPPDHQCGPCVCAVRFVFSSFVQNWLLKPSRSRVGQEDLQDAFVELSRLFEMLFRQVVRVRAVVEMRQEGDGGSEQQRKQCCQNRQKQDCQIWKRNFKRESDRRKVERANSDVRKKRYFRELQKDLQTGIKIIKILAATMPR